MLSLIGAEIVVLIMMLHLDNRPGSYDSNPSEFYVNDRLQDIQCLDRYWKAFQVRKKKPRTP